MKGRNLFRETAEVWIRGENTAECLNLLAAEALPFWNILLSPEKELRVRLYARDLERAAKLCLSACCDLQPVSTGGLPKQLQKLKRRPLLVIGLLLAMLLPFLLQRYVWAVEIRGEDPGVDHRIRQILQENGVGFGTVGEGLDSQQIKLKMLSQLPELGWMAVNRRGGKLTVLYLMANPEAEIGTPTAANLVALRDAVITDFTVLEGMRLFSSGDAVRKGQLLVSGFEDYGLCLRAVQAEGEIYGETWRSGTVLSPAKQKGKTYTGREWTEYVCIIGRKRINLCGSSGISTTTCDKIISEFILRLPELEFPLRIQKIRHREYTLSEVPIVPAMAEAALEQRWQESIRQQMVAGTILQTERSFLAGEHYFTLHIRSRCHEMIAMTVPMEGLNKGEAYE